MAIPGKRTHRRSIDRIGPPKRVVPKKRDEWDCSWTMVDIFCRSCWRAGKAREAATHQPIDGNRKNVAWWNRQGTCTEHSR